MQRGGWQRNTGTQFTGINARLSRGTTRSTGNRWAICTFPTLSIERSDSIQRHRGGFQVLEEQPVENTRRTTRKQAPRKYAARRRERLWDATSSPRSFYTSSRTRQCHNDFSGTNRGRGKNHLLPWIPRKRPFLAQVLCIPWSYPPARACRPASVAQGVT